MLNHFGHIPSLEFPISEAESNKIMHIALPIGKNSLMATHGLESMGQNFEIGNKSSTSISAESREEAGKLFNGNSVGEKIEMPIVDSP